jgi:hypothetical protein
MSTKDALVTTLLAALALAGGIFMGYSDSRSDDPAITLLILGTFTFLLGALGPRRAWLWPLLAGVWVPALDTILPRLRLAPREAGFPPTLLSVLAVLGLVMAVCFAGSYAGAFLAGAARRAISSRHF